MEIAFFLSGFLVSIVSLAIGFGLGRGNRDDDDE